MYILYIDESGDPSLSEKSINSDPLFILGGCAIFEGNWDSLQKRMDKIVNKYFPDDEEPVELHFSEIRKGKGIWKKFSVDERRNIITDVFSETDKLNSRCLTYFSIVVDKRDVVGEANDVYKIAFEVLISRFDLFLKRNFATGYPNKGMLVSDLLSDTSKASEKKLLPLIELFKSKGTRWAQLRNIVEKIFFHDSKNSRATQLADFIVSATNRYYNAGEIDYI